MDITKQNRTGGPDAQLRIILRRNGQQYGDTMNCRIKPCAAWLTALLILFAWTAPAWGATKQDPRQLVMATAEKLVHELQAQQHDIARDPAVAFRLANQTVVPYIDFPRIARWVAGRYWRTASPDQRRRFTEEFRQLLITTYVAAMRNYAQEILTHADDVSYPPVRPDPNANQSTVRMDIRLASGIQIPVDYRLYRTNGGWKIYDVVVQGISLVVTYRQTLSGQFDRLGFAGVLNKLAAHNAAMSK